MAATNPFRVSDLIAKYGWKVMPYLSNLGPMLLAEAQVLFVDSEHINALDADDTEHGHSFEKPLDTIDYAIGLCTAAERSVILVAPGHIETLAAATVAFDVSDITIIGIGEGTNRPRIDFGNALSSVDISANNVHLINLRFVPGITTIAIGVDVMADVTGTIIENCEFAEGTVSGSEFVLGVDVKAGCTNTKITKCLFRTIVDADGCTHAVKLTGISDNVIIEKSRFIGNWSTAAIGGDTGISTDVLIDDCTMKVKDGEPGIEMLTGTTGIIRNVCIESTTGTVDTLIVADGMSWFNNYGVIADNTAAEIIGGGEVNAQMVAHGLDHLVTLADGTDAYPASVVQDSILAKLISKDEPPVKTSFDNTTDSLEAISDKIGASNGGIAYFVDNDSGSNSNDGLGWDTAKADLDHAIGSTNGVVSNYDVVYVRGTATYEESVATGTEVGVKIIGVGDGKLNPLWTSAAAGEVALTLNGQGWEVHNFLFHGGSKTASMIQVTLAGGGSVIENCYFHGGASSLSAVQYTGGSLQNKLIGNHITQFGATHGDSGNNYEAAVWGNSYNQSACDYEIRDNVFSDNTNHLKLQAVDCLIRGNTFVHDGYNDDATVVIDLHCSAIEASNGNNIVVDNYFGHDSSELTVTNGYRFRDNDYIGGNHCIDGDSGGKPAGEAKAYYVDSDNGVDTNSGLSWGRAFNTIQAAVTAAGAYDTIYCRGGASFEEDVTIAVAKYGLKLIGISDTVMFPTWKSTGTTATHLTINAGVVEVHNFHFYGANHTVPFVLVDRSGAAGAYSTLIKNNWFDGANTSDYCIRYTDTVQNKLIGNYIKGFDGTAVGYTGTVQCAQYEITDNNFMDNVNHLVMALNYSVVKGNNFQHSGYANDATIMLDVTGVQNPAIGTTGGNCIIGNYFKDLKADINNANGYYGVTSDQWIGNYCIDGISSGGGAVASSATTNPLLGKRVTRTKSDLMDGTTTTVFTIAGGDVLITALYGTVEDAAHAAVGDTCKFQVNPTTGSATDLCGTTDMTGKEEGTLISVNGVAGTALVVAESGSVPAMLEPVVAASGILTFVSGGNDSNATKLQLNLWYFPLDDGATVVVA